MSQNTSSWDVEVHFPSTSGLLAVLSTIRPGSQHVSSTGSSHRGLHGASSTSTGGMRQIALVNFSSEGLSVKWEHSSKALQSGIFLGRGLFSLFKVSEETEFCVSLTTLLDVLAVFASEDLGELSLRYPGPNAELMLECSQASIGNENNIYSQRAHIASVSLASSQVQMAQNLSPSMFARISTYDKTPFFDLLDHFTEPSSHFIAPGNILREAVYDLDWTQADAVLIMRRDPHHVSFCSSNNRVTLEIELPKDQLTAFSCAVPSLKWEYRQRHLKTIFANVGSKRDRKQHLQDITTKLSVDSQGLMRVTHILQLMMPSNESRDEESVTSHLGVAQFALLPLVDDVDNEYDDGAVSNLGAQNLSAEHNSEMTL